MTHLPRCTAYGKQCACPRPAKVDHKKLLEEAVAEQLAEIEARKKPDQPEGSAW